MKIDAKVKDLLLASYKEVLDAVKHQDDKIGRLFTGIAFLTAAALAMANLGSAKYLSQDYVGWWDAPPAMLSLAGYILLVLMSVTILIGSLGTPLRVPGLSRTTPDRDTFSVEPRQASQIYFGEISKLTLAEWKEKWTGDKKLLDIELTQSLVGETHNLAARTQFKYGRMNEAIALFNLALLFLAVTMILCVGSASADAPERAVVLPGGAQWALAIAVGGFFYLQLLSQVRYTRQTIDELEGWQNRLGGALRYAWLVLASAWVVLVGSHRFVDGCAALIVWIVAASGASSLLAGTVLQRRLKRVPRGSQPMQWLGPAVAILAGLPLSILSTMSDEHGHGFPYSFGLTLVAAGLLTALAVASPTLNVYRNVRRSKEAAAARLGASSGGGANGDQNPDSCGGVGADSKA